MTDQKSPPPAVPSATIMLLRDGADGLEVLMLQRSEEMAAFSGKLVFPGGKVTEDEASEAIRERSAGLEDMPEGALAFRAAAIREAFEEVGILLARPAGGEELVGPEGIHGMEQERRALATDAMRFDDFLEREDLSLATDLLVPFAHWITPEFSKRRFDTWFYLARAPEAQMGVQPHDRMEATETIWLTPSAVLADADARRRSVIFATRLNLMKLAQSKTVDEALDRARRGRVVAVMPERVETAEGARLRIPPEAGYPVSEMDIEKAAGR